MHGLSGRATPLTLYTSTTFNNKITTTTKNIVIFFTKQFTNILGQATQKTVGSKRTKLSRIILLTPQIISQLLSIEEQIRSSHLKEKIHEEHVVVSKIKVDPKHFFRYAKRYSICKQEVGPLLNPLNNTLTDNK